MKTVLEECELNLFCSIHEIKQSPQNGGREMQKCSMESSELNFEGKASIVLLKNWMFG